jgi:hypothetical protein
MPQGAKRLKTSFSGCGLCRQVYPSIETGVAEQAGLRRILRGVREMLNEARCRPPFLKPIRGDGPFLALSFIAIP